MTTTPIASPELPDLDKLEALARAATPGPWAYQEDSDVYTHIVRPVQSPGNIVRHYAQDTSGVVEANARFTAGANPAAVLALIALARRAQPEGEAPQAEPSKLYVEARECSSCLHVGINDSSDTLAACHSCDWSGPSPAEDHCPGCDQDGCMGSACPKCGAIYKLLAEKNIAATLSPLCGAQHAESGKEALAAVSSKLAAVWQGVRDAVAKYSGKPCEGEPFDRLDELLAAQQAAAPAWHKVTGPGQVEVGARLRFNIGDKKFSERAKLILNAGAENEEVIYDKGRNFYFITSCVMSGFSNHKNVEFMPPKRAAQLDGGQEGSAS